MDKILELYNNISKHSNYQKLPKSLIPHIGNVEQNINRYESERWEFIKNNIDISGKKILDIGANTGYFSISSAECNSSITAIEYNKNHCLFLQECASILNLKIIVVNDYYDFTKELDTEFDFVFILNVLHHIGDDFENQIDSVELAKIKILEYINLFSKNAKNIVFQMGFCWKGDKKLPIFKYGSKKEMISFIKEGTKNNWKISNIGILNKKKLKYVELDTSNIERDDTLGEFGNRPIFILKNKLWI